MNCYMGGSALERQSAAVVSFILRHEWSEGNLLTMLLSHVVGFNSVSHFQDSLLGYYMQNIFCLA